MRTPKLFLLLLTALLVGICIGFFTNRAIIKTRVEHYRAFPADLSQHIMEKMTEGLDLSTEQQQKIQIRVDDYVEQRKEQRTIRKAQQAERLAEMGRDVAQYLTPEQREEFKLMMDRVEARRKARCDQRRESPEARTPTPQ